MRLVLAAVALSLGATVAAAQDYPERSIHVVVPYSAGGPTDTIARLTADAMSKHLDQQVVVENVTGAGGTIGTRNVADAEADGYTILVHHIGMSTAPSLYRQLPFNALEDFAPIGLISDAAMTVVARTDFPAGSFAELAAHIKEQGMDVTYAHAGIGAASHLCGTLFMSTLGTKMTTVPYKGNGPIMTDLIGKQVDLTCDQITNTVGPISEGQVKAYGITSPERSSHLPDVPTTAEEGLESFQLSVWHGAYAPAGTPPEVVAKLSAALQAAMQDPTLIERFGQLATTPASPDQAVPEALHARLASEIGRWKPIIEAAGEFAD